MCRVLGGLPVEFSTKAKNAERIPVFNIRPCIKPGHLNHIAWTLHIILGHLKSCFYDHGPVSGCIEVLSRMFSDRKHALLLRQPLPQWPLFVVENTTKECGSRVSGLE